MSGRCALLVAWLCAAIWTLASLEAGHAHPSSGIVVDAAGNVVFADERRNIVWKFAPDGALTRLVEGKHSHHLAIDAAGRVHGEDLQYVASTRSWRGALWSIDPADPVRGVRITWGPHDGLPPGLVADASGHRYEARGSTAEGVPFQIVRRDTAGAIQVLAGGATDPRDGLRTVDGIGTQARLEQLVAMTLGPDDVVYFTDADAVRTLDRANQVRTLARVAGVRDPALPGDFELWGLVVDERGVVFVADYGRRQVLEVDPAGRLRQRMQCAPPWSPTGVALAGDDLVVLEHGFRAPAENLGPRVRRVSPSGEVRVLATLDSGPAPPR